MTPYPHCLTLVAETGESVDTGVEIDASLPEWLANTANHVNCPHQRVPIVLVGENHKPMVFRGVVTKAPAAPSQCQLRYAKVGDIAVSKPRAYGHAGHLYFVPSERINPAN